MAALVCGARAGVCASLLPPWPRKAAVPAEGPCVDLAGQLIRHSPAKRSPNPRHPAALGPVPAEPVAEPVWQTGTVQLPPASTQGWRGGTGRALAAALPGH